MKNFNRGDRHSDRHFDRRDNRRGFDRSRPSMHSAICDACHKECQVPFKPTGDKPIYCSDCFSKQGGGNRDRKPRFDGPRPTDNSKEILDNIKSLNYKLDQLLKTLASNSPAPVEKPKVAVEKKPAKKAATKKKTVKKATTKKKTATKKVAKKKK